MRPRGGQATVIQAGGNVVVGGVFADPFARLRDRWLDPGPIFRDVQVEMFAGREWSIAAAIGPDSVVVSGLGVTGKKEAGTLTAGARAVVAARPARIVWLGAQGTGRSAAVVGRLTARLLRAGFGAEYGDKVAADTAVLDAGGTVLHSGPLSGKPDRPGTRALPLAAAGRRFFPRGTPRATVARLMLYEAESGAHRGKSSSPPLPADLSGRH